MPRRVRQQSGSGIYHVMMRGINRQTIFEDEADYQKFLQTILKYKAQCGYEIHAYCLMSNHVHLLIKVGKESLGQIMQRICGSYVYWYNWKYQRVGNLFQDRFKSEAVEDDTYFLQVQRYIHQNPVKAGLVDDVEDYRWSSYNEYIKKGRITDCSLLLQMFNDNQEQSKQDFIEFNHTTNNDHFLDLEEKKRVNDEEAKNTIRRICKMRNATDLQQLEIQTRNKYLRDLKEAGLSVRQIERLTGINRGVVLKA
jgi:REP element-mobilizing transposase RayT